MIGKITLILAAAGTFFIPISPALSQAVAPTSYMTYVSRTGSGDTCTRSSPCNNFSAAFARTYADGTIVCNDPGDYGALQITRSVMIDCGGVTGSNGAGGTITNESGDAGIFINIPPGSSSSKVTLRGLSLFSAPVLVYIRSATVVSIEDSVFDGGVQGIHDRRTSGQTRLYVTNSTVKNINAPGIIVASQGGSSTVLDNVRLLNNRFGLAAATGNNVVIKNSMISGNTTAGVHADTGAQINVSNSTLSHNTAHLNAFGVIRLKENELQFSNVAIQGGGARSLGANRFAGNISIGSLPVLASGAPADVYD